MHDQTHSLENTDSRSILARMSRLTATAALLALAHCGGEGLADGEIDGSEPIAEKEQGAGTGVVPAGPYTNWNWPPTPTYPGKTKKGFYNFDHLIRVESDPGASTKYFYAHQFGMHDGIGGYIGIQEGSLGKVAMISIWGATSASGPNCVPFDESGTGYSCRLPYAWVQGHTYRLRIWTTADNAWGAWVKDTNTGIESYIGTLTVPASWNWLKSDSVMWTEYYAANNPAERPPTCAGVPYTRSWLSEPTANGGSVHPTSNWRHIGAGDCTSTTVTQVASGGVRQEVGWGSGCTLWPDDMLLPGEGRNACGAEGIGLYHQGDGNVVLYGPSGALWHTGTWGKATKTLTMQGDGNLVLYAPNNTPLWHTSTWGHPGARLVVQSDCNTVIYGPGALWHTSTWGCVKH